MFDRVEARARRRARIRRRAVGRPGRPRLAVFRSARHIYAQVIDDLRGVTLVCASSCEGASREQSRGKKKVEVAAAVGRAIAERCKGKGIATVVFDRGGYRYHGRVAALAKAAREGGLVF